MHPAKLLIKATPKSMTIGGVHGGKPIFDSIDAAHALSGLNPVLSRIAYYRFCGDDSLKNKVLSALYMKSVRLAKDNGYKLKRETLAGLCKAALEQLERPACIPCDGHGYKLKGDLDPEVCTKCVGTGYQMISGRQIARLAGLSSHKSITYRHMKLFYLLVEYLKDSETKILAHVADKSGCVNPPS